MTTVRILSAEHQLVGTGTVSVLAISSKHQPLLQPALGLPSGCTQELPHQFSFLLIFMVNFQWECAKCSMTERRIWLELLLSFIVCEVMVVSRPLAYSLA